MRIRVSKLALIVLQGCLGLIVIAEAAFLAFVRAQVKAFSKTGLPDWVRLLLAWSELLSASLFLIPRATIMGDGACCWLSYSPRACMLFIEDLMWERLSFTRRPLWSS